MKKELFDIDTALLTRRTVVRRLREQEGGDFYDLIVDNETHLRDSLPHIVQANSSKEKSEWYVRQTISKWLSQEEFAFGIFDKSAAKLIGFIKVYRIDWFVPKGEITFFIHRDYRQKGFMTEAMLAVRDFAFEQLHFEKIKIKTVSDNYAAQRLLKKCDFKREGDLRNEHRTQGGILTDIAVFGLPKF